MALFSDYYFISEKSFFMTTGATLVRFCLPTLAELPDPEEEDKEDDGEMVPGDEDDDSRLMVEGRRNNGLFPEKDRQQYKIIFKSAD